MAKVPRRLLSLATAAIIVGFVALPAMAVDVAERMNIGGVYYTGIGGNCTNALDAQADSSKLLATQVAGEAVPNVNQSPVADVVETIYSLAAEQAIELASFETKEANGDVQLALLGEPVEPDKIAYVEANGGLKGFDTGDGGSTLIRPSGVKDSARIHRLDINGDG